MEGRPWSQAQANEAYKLLLAQKLSNINPNDHGAHAHAVAQARAEVIRLGGPNVAATLQGTKTTFPGGVAMVEGKVVGEHPTHTRFAGKRKSRKRKSRKRKSRKRKSRKRKSRKRKSRKRKSRKRKSS